METNESQWQRTLSVDTRSAVSSRVSLLISSTMLAILGFASGADAAASVELYRLAATAAAGARLWRRETGARRELAERNCRAQLCAAYLQDMAIFSAVSDGRWGRADSYERFWRLKLVRRRPGVQVTLRLNARLSARSFSRRTSHASKPAQRVRTE